MQGQKAADEGVIPKEMFEAVADCQEEAELNFWRQSVNQHFNATRAS